MNTTKFHDILGKLASNFEETRRMAGKHSKGAKDEIALVSNLLQEIGRLRDVLEKIEREDFSWCSKEQLQRFNFLSVMMDHEDEGIFLKFKEDLVKEFCRKSLDF